MEMSCGRLSGVKVRVTDSFDEGLSGEQSMLPEMGSMVSLMTVRLNSDDRSPIYMVMEPEVVVSSMILTASVAPLTTEPWL